MARSSAVLALIALLAGCSFLLPPPEPEPVLHTVVRGDTLSKLAKQHDTTVAQLQDWNGLSGDRIDVGQALIVGYTGGEAPEAAVVASKPSASRKKPRPRTTAPEAAPGVSGLTLPTEQPCLAGPTLDGSDDDPAFAGSAGLSREQVRQAMNGFLPTLNRCVTGDWPTGTLNLSITVACTGRVDRVRVQDAGGLDAALVTCITETLRYAPFPAHDLPDGETFGYPMVFSR
jgi:murein DD-endopeptidase MepM/ murein hydrolase activator NlpD